MALSCATMVMTKVEMIARMRVVQPLAVMVSCVIKATRVKSVMTVMIALGTAVDGPVNVRGAATVKLILVKSAMMIMKTMRTRAPTVV